MASAQFTLQAVTPQRHVLGAFKHTKSAPALPRRALTVVRAEGGNTEKPASIKGVGMATLAAAVLSMSPMAQAQSHPQELAQIAEPGIERFFAGFSGQKDSSEQRSELQEAMGTKENDIPGQEQATLKDNPKDTPQDRLSAFQPVQPSRVANARENALKDTLGKTSDEDVKSGQSNPETPGIKYGGEGVTY